MLYQKECNSHIPKRQPVPHTTTRTIEESKRNNKKIALIILDIKKCTKPNCNLINYIIDLC